MLDIKPIGRWQPIKELGSGGQAIVYKAVDNKERLAFLANVRSAIRINAQGFEHSPEKFTEAEELLTLIGDALKGDKFQCAALRVLHLHGTEAEQRKARQRMANSIEALRAVQHPHLVKLLEFEDTWCALEFVDGVSLHDAPEHFKGDAYGALKAISGIVEAVAALHEKGFVHRDIKPGNIFIKTDGQLVLGDLGLVYTNQDDGARLTETEEKAGTRDFMPPWYQKPGRHKVDATMDIFALAKVLWCMLLGQTTAIYYHIDHEEEDIRLFYQGDRLANFIFHEILSKCLVDRKEKCMPKIRGLQNAIARLLDEWTRSSDRKCAICRTGKYIITNSDKVRIYCYCEDCLHEASFLKSAPQKGK